jgi:inorganic pyrophosphatase
MKKPVQYKTEFQGLPIAIETRKNQFRHWYDPGADEHGKTKMLYPYGYVVGTLGLDGDEVDVYIGPHKDSQKVFVITQLKRFEFKDVDEQKIMLGFNDPVAAKTTYLQHFNQARFFGNMQEMTLDEFKTKLKAQRGKLVKGKMADGGFSKEETVKIAKVLSLDLSKEAFTVDELCTGLNEELEHKDVTHASAVATAKIALAHLKEDPKYYSKLKQAMNKSLLLNLPESAKLSVHDMLYIDLNKSGVKDFKPSAPKPGSEVGSKTKYTVKSTSCKAKTHGEACADKEHSLDEEDMDLKKKFKSKKQVKYMHAAAERGDVSESVLKEFKEKTPKKAYKDLPESSSKTEKALEESNDLLKALRANVVSSLAKRDRLNAAYQVGLVEGRKSPFTTEPVELSHDKLDIGIDKSHVRPLHEPPAVPVRKVETPTSIPLKECGEHKYRTAVVGPQEATPVWRR